MAWATYTAVFKINLQQELQRRASLIMERVRSLTLVISLYFLWASLLTDPSREFLGYSRSQMLTYVLGLAILRALVLTNRAFELTWEIARGRLSALLMRPISIFKYQLALDLSDKTVRVLAAIVEVAVLVVIFKADLYWPHSIIRILLTVIAISLAMALYYFIGLSLASSGFWTAESIGFLWAASLFMEFCSGAFFPLDVLPQRVQEVFKLLPFPYLVYFPINIYLERLSFAEIIQGFILLIIWIGVFYGFVRWIWAKGLSDYQAEGG